MGTFTHPITLYSASGDSPETVEALVDTSSSFTSLPVPLLERLGVTRLASVRLRLATGEVVERDIGAVMAALADQEARPVLCVFGDPGAPPAIGTQTLESFLLGVDRQRLVPVEGWWA